MLGLGSFVRKVIFTFYSIVSCKLHGSVEDGVCSYVSMKDPSVISEVSLTTGECTYDEYGRRGGL